jgi:hypothetical protein
MLTLFDTNFMTFSHTIHDKTLDTWKLPVMSHRENNEDIYYNLLKEIRFEANICMTCYTLILA